MWRVLPKLMPDWLAPLFEPYWREMTFWPAFNCSSLKFLTFFSASFGPIDDLPKLWALKMTKLLVQDLLMNRRHLLFCPTTANRWQPSSSFDVPTSQQIGRFLELEHRMPWQLPRMLKCFPCTWTPFCFRWPSSRFQVGVRWPVCTRWLRP